MPNVLLTFEDLHAGDIVNGQYSSNGVTISSANPHTPPMVFDTSHPTGGDHDLATDNLGNVLILSEDGDSSDPDDNAGGGTFIFEFDEPSEVINFMGLDLEEGGTVRLYDETGKLFKTVHIDATSNNAQQIVDINADNVSRMEIELCGSGAIDGICYCTPDQQEEPVLDGVVEGSNDAEVIDVNYEGDPDGDRIDANDALLPGEIGDDDIVDAFGGDDTINSGAGDDEVYAGSGDDTVDGGAGDDVIYGDSNYSGPGAGTSVRESFEWDLQTENEVDTSFVQDTGNVEVTFTRLADVDSHDSFLNTEQLNVDGIDGGSETVDTDSGLTSITNGEDGRGEFQWEFSTPVTDVEFNINDIDGDGVVQVTAFDADGNEIPVQLSGGSGVTLIDTDGANGADTADSNGGYGATPSDEYNLQVNIPGPVARIVVEHTQDDDDNSGIRITDIFFDVDTSVVDDGADGNDVLNGGAGNDTIFGEGGNDTLDGGEGDDLLSGGDDRDTIIAGAGDTVDGGTGSTAAGDVDDFDTLDLTGEGPFRVVGETEDADGNSTSGTVEFLNPDGSVSGSLTFTEIEQILGDRVNQGPDANDDTASVDEDDSVTIDVLANDTDPENDDLTVIDASSPDGEVAINADGTITFKPDENFNGDTTITYTIEDEAGNTDTATVDVTVAPVNDDPVANDDAVSTDEDTPVTIPVLDNDTDLDGDDLTVTEATSPDGEVVINADGTITFTPDENFNGVTTITYTVSDGNGGEDTATVTVTVDAVNDDLVAGDDTAETDEDTPVDIDVLANDVDPDGDDLTVTEATSPDGEVTINPDGTLTFTPDENFTGETTITYTVEDGNGSEDTATVTVTVNPVNDAPDAVDDSDTTTEDTAITVDLLANDTDVDGDDLTVIEATVPADQGTLVDNGDGTVTFTPAPDFNGTATISYTISDGELEDSAVHTIDVTAVNDTPEAEDDTAETDEDTPVTIDVLANDSDPDGDPLEVTEATSPDGEVTINPDGTITFTPDENFNGETTISYTVSDPDGNEDTATVTVNVAPVNDAPDAVNDTDTTDEDTPITLDVLANDTDVDGDDLTVTGATVPAEQGTVEIVDNKVVFTPAENFNGLATISYSISDGNGGTDTAIHEVDVLPVNDDPVAVDDIAETEEDTAVVIDLIANDFDVDGDDLTIGTVSVPPEQGTVVDNGDGTVTFTPAPNYTGPAQITYTVVDGQGGEDVGGATVNVFIEGVNDGPDAVDDAVTTDEDTPITIDALANDTDLEGDDLTITGASVPGDQGSVEIVGNELVFTSAPDFNGEATITYSITDGNGGTDTAEVVVTVLPVNDDPVAVDDVETTDEDEPITIDLISNDTDVDGDDLSVGSVSVPPEQGTVVDNGDGTVTFTPAPNFNGPATITYTVIDGQGGEDEGEAIVSVGAINDGPDAVDDSDTTAEDTPITVDLLANDTDADGDDLSVISATVPADQGTLLNNGDGTVTFTPAPDFNGEATISYEISDGNGGTDTAVHTITVTPEGDAPEAEDDVAETDEDTPVTIDVLANDSDPDGDPLEVTEATSPDGEVTINPDGTITFTPDENFNGETTITYTVSDPDGNEDTATVTVNVAPVNDAPDAVDDSDTTTEDTAITVDLLANDSDVDGDDLTVIEATVPADQGTLVDNGDGTVTFTPAPDFNGTATISYTISDGELEDSAIHTIDVTAVNDTPEAEDDTAETDEDTPVTIDVLANDSDPDGDPLEVTEATSPDGEVTINPDGTITFTPDENFNGETTITYTVSDPDGNEDTATVTVNVAPVNDDPVAEDDTVETDEDTPVDITPLANDSDVDGDTLTITEITQPANGEAVLNPDGTITYTPDPDFSGEDMLTYTVEDGNGGTDTATITINVGEVNDGPDAVDDRASTNNLTPVTIAVLANDTDPENDPLTVTEASVDVGEVTINPDGTLEYTPVPEFGGVATITYTITDGNGGFDTAIVTVGVNDGIVEGTAGDDLIDVDYMDDPEGDMVDNNDEFLPGEGPQDDIILAGDGNDTVNAGEGDDEVYGQDGDDILNGEAGDDYLSGGEGDDIISGGDGDDVLDAGQGSDQLFGEDGNDTLLGGPGTDLLDGGAGDDEIIGGNNDDEIIGGTGNDTIEGNAGDDTIRANQGDDVIDGGDGDDTIGGGSGNDEIDGGEGDDTIQAGDGDDTVIGGLGNDDIQGNDGDDTIDGGEGDDTISSGAGDDTITGGAGNDTVTEAGSGDDVIDLGDGDDVVESAGSGDDTVTGGAGNDTITTNDGNDTVFGGEGDDVIDTSGHAPLPDLGYPGLFPSDPNPNDDIDFVDGGDGDDIISTGDDADTIIGGAGNDTIDGGLDADTIDGGDGDDRIVGGEGSDVINAGAGDDVVYAGIDPDLGLPDNLDIADVDGDLVPNNGQDVVNGGDGNDTIFGADDDDVLNGDAGDDFIDGGVDDDTISGGTGNDTLIGGQGADTISGGDDRDTIIVDNAEDAIGDVVDGGTGSTAAGDVDDFDVLDLTGAGPLRIVGETVDADGNSTSGTVEFLDGVGGNVIGTLEFSEIEQIVPCFTPGTSIATPRGEVLVEDLMVGDKIITRDNGIQEIRWIGAKRMDGRELQNNPHLQPVLIQKGSLGNGLPERDMLVSPNHRMLVNNDRVSLYFDENEVLVSAKHLVNPTEGVQSINSMGTTYIHFMFDNHEVVLSNGAWTESFQPGDYSLKGIGNAQRNEIFELFPELQGEAGREAYASARLTLKKHEAKLLFK
ncbi:CshA-type fibril repeat protein [Litoreibacter ponti]|uniref:CshA-type fibril repeat protein n=1 Tax=Litoreibacter ponti TaxID=1510457 RepID=A0A2T6BID9_9RHOB|nr:tandem-95 repeat protein [Litoreibacter ponti]PTX55830.1 CshA-type fibril repeat protein [Litoreibacter ponti]